MKFSEAESTITLKKMHCILPAYISAIRYHEDYKQVQMKGLKK